MHDSHGHGHGNGHGSHDGGYGPLVPASSNIGVGGSVILVVAILTSIMQGSFVVGSSRDMHMWQPSAALASGTAPWSPQDPDKLELPPYNPQ